MKQTNFGSDTEPIAAGTTTAGQLKVAQVYEQVAARLIALVRTGRLTPGQRLPSERELARQLGVGRPAVREAIAALQVDGLVETRPGSGSYVSASLPENPAVWESWTEARPTVSAEDADIAPSALLEARLALEPSIARLAALPSQPDERAEELLEVMEHHPDPEQAEGRAQWSDADRLFHRQLATMTGNLVLITVADYVAAVMDQPLWRRLRDESVSVPGRMKVHMAEHRMIYEAVAAGDSELAEFYARHHIERVRRYMTLDP